MAFSFLNIFSSFFVLSFLFWLSISLKSGNKEINKENNSVKNEEFDFAVFISFILFELLDIDILLLSFDITSLNS